MSVKFFQKFLITTLLSINILLFNDSYSQQYQFVREISGYTQDPPIAQFNDPFDVATDASGNVYVVDKTNHRIQKFNSSGDFIAKWGTLGSGDGQFNLPAGITTDVSGNVYVADEGNNRIQKFSSSGVFLTKWGSTGSGDGQFGNPYDVAVDATGNIYVTERSNRRIQKFTSAGAFISKWGISGTGDGEFISPRGIAIDASENVYVVDQGNRRIQKYSSSGVYITQWGSNGSGDGQFNNAVNIAIDGAGNINVTDGNNHRVQVFSSSGTFLTKWGSNGSGDGEFTNPFGIAIDINSNDIFITEVGTDRIQKFNSSYSYLSQWGSLGNGNGQFYRPTGIAIDISGNAYVADFVNNRIQKFDSDGNYITQWGNQGVGNGEFNHPIRIAIDYSGNLYVADQYNHRIQKFDSDGNYLTQWGSNGSGNGQFNYPNDVVIDNNGNVYVSDQNNHRIQKFNSSGTYLTQFGSEIPNFYSFGVAINSSGDVYVADSGNRCIHKFKSTGEHTLQWGSDGNGNGQFRAPEGISMDNDGNVYVTDRYLNRIQKFDSDGNYITQWGSTGTANSEFQSCKGITIDASGNVYVADEINNRIQIFAESPNILISGSLIVFTSTYGIASTEQSFSVSGSNLTSDVDIQVPASYELSSSSSGPYQNNLTVSPTSGTLSSTTIYIRLKSDALAGVVGSSVITLSTTGATDQTLIIPAGSVAKAALTVTAADQIKTYGSSNPTLIISYTGFVNGDDAADITEPTASTLATSTSEVGDYAITLSGGSASNYNITLVDGTLTINPASLTATADDQSRKYGSVNPTLTISYSGFVDGDDQNDITGPTISCLADVTSPVSGSPYAINLSGGSAANYTLTLEDGELMVTPAALTIIADDASKNEGETNPAFTVSYSGFVNSEDESVLGCTVVATTSADNTSAPGDYAIEVADCGLTNTNYTYTFVNGTLTINFTTGVKHADNSNSVKVYPNPSNGRFTVSEEGEEVQSIRVINMLGEEEVFLTGEVETRMKGILILEIETTKSIILKKISVK